MKKLICSMLACSLLHTICWAGKTEEFKKRQQYHKKAILQLVAQTTNTIDSTSDNFLKLNVQEPMRSIEYKDLIERVIQTELDPHNKVIHTLGLNRKNELVAVLYNILFNKFIYQTRGDRTPIFDQKNNKYMLLWPGKANNGVCSIVNIETGESREFYQTRYGFDNMFRFVRNGERVIGFNDKNLLLINPDDGMTDSIELQDGCKALYPNPNTQRTMVLLPNNNKKVFSIFDSASSKITYTLEYHNTVLKSWSDWIPRNTAIWICPDTNLIFYSPEPHTLQGFNPECCVKDVAFSLSSNGIFKNLHHPPHNSNIERRNAWTEGSEPALYIRDSDYPFGKKIALKEPVTRAITYNTTGTLCMPYDWNKKTYYIYNLETTEEPASYTLAHDDTSEILFPYFYNDYLLVFHNCLESKQMVVFDLKKMELVTIHSFGDTAIAGALSPDGSAFTLASTTENKELVSRVYQSNEKEPIYELKYTGSLEKLPPISWINNDLVVLLKKDTAIEIYSCKERTVKTTLITAAKITAVALNNDRTILSVSQIGEKSALTDQYDVSKLVGNTMSVQEPVEYFEVQDNHDGTTTYVQDGKEYTVDLETKELLKQLAEKTK